MQILRQTKLNDCKIPECRAGQLCLRCKAERERQARRFYKVRSARLHPDRVRQAWAKTRYGANLSELRARQNDACAICGRKTRLAVDHDHKTGAVRGLLCYRCNRAIASLDDPHWLELAKAYLERTR